LRFISKPTSPNELIGHEFPDQLRDDIESISIADIEKIKTKNIHVLNCHDSDRLDALMNGDNFLTKTKNVTFYDIDSNPDWLNINKVESKVLPDMSIEKIIEVVG